MQRRRDLIDPPWLRPLTNAIAVEQRRRDLIDPPWLRPLTNAIAVEQRRRDLIDPPWLRQINAITATHRSFLHSTFPCPSIVPSHLSHILSHPSITPLPIRDALSITQQQIFRDVSSILERERRLFSHLNLDLFQSQRPLTDAIALEQTKRDLREFKATSALEQMKRDLIDSPLQRQINAITATHRSFLHSTFPCPSIVPSHLSHILSYPSITPLPIRDVLSTTPFPIFSRTEYNILLNLISTFEREHRLSQLSLDLFQSQPQKYKTRLLNAVSNIKHRFLRKIADPKTRAKLLDTIVIALLLALPEPYHPEALVFTYNIIRILQSAD